VATASRLKPATAAKKLLMEKVEESFMGFRVLSASSPNYRSDGPSSGKSFSVDLRIF
jgi:hypothetical protein